MFVEVSSVNYESPSAALVFCTALMSTVDAFRTRPSPQLCVECVRVALAENSIDLLTHWLSQRRQAPHILHPAPSSQVILLFQMDLRHTM